MDRSPTNDRRLRARARRSLGVAVSPPAPRRDDLPERGSAGLDDSLVGRLQAVRDYPCASVLMSTTPGARMTTGDGARLDGMVASAGRRMAAEAPHHTTEPVLARLHRLALDARGTQTGHAIALYASEVHDAAVALPIPVVDRVVVDPTFATRDLVRALARRPRVRIVVASERRVRLLEGWSGQLAEVGIDGRGGRAAEAVMARHRRDPLPVVVAGVAREVEAWRGVATVADACIGSIPGHHHATSAARLDELCRPLVDEHLRAERQEALGRLSREHPDRCASGIDAVWVAAGAGRVGLLCVEDGFTYRARPARDGDGLEVADDRDHPAVLDDAVDEIIEMVHRSGGRVVIVPDAALADHGSVAALLRPGGERPVSASGSWTAT
jgi:hypothetical protein